MTKWIFVKEHGYEAWQGDNPPFIMAELKNEYYLNGKASIKICADTKYELYVNNELVGTGPASAGGDFEALPNVLAYSYYDEYTINAKGRVEIRAVITATPTVLCEYTFKHPGLWLELRQNGRLVGKTDEGWQGRRLPQRLFAEGSDYTIPPLPYGEVFVIPDAHKLKKSPLEHIVNEKIYPSNFKPIYVEPKKKAKIKLDFAKIYSAYLNLSLKCNGRVKIKIITEELDNVSTCYEELVSDRSIFHRSQHMFSVGQATLEIENESQDECIIDDFYISFVHYPVKNEAYLKTSDKSLNKIYDVCMHTLKICRQDIHLDSPKHQEPLACTGDYYIQALMEYLNIYDPTLTAFDIVRTAEMLKRQNGKIFHTSYSLMFPMWLYDYYLYTGDKKLINKTRKALECLFSRFDSYTSTKNNLVEKAPNYMFVDWIVMKDAPDPYGDAREMMSHGQIDGFSLHHPPKALGQSVLCMFYYQALITGAKLYNVIDKPEKARELSQRAMALKDAINTHLYDAEKALYIGGLTTKNEVENNWLPENAKRTFYLKQANTLAVLFDIAPREQRSHILDFVASDLRKEEMQPYFYHFLLEALYNEGLLEKYGFNLIYRYNDLISKTDKGLCEAWEYINCDCSHAWGGTPAYILKKAITGFEIIEPGYKKIRLKPSLYHLEHASLNISTPYGNIDINLQKGKKPQIVAPKEIEIIYE